MYVDLVEAHLLWASQGPPKITENHPCHPPIKVMEIYGKDSPHKPCMSLNHRVTESRDIEFPLDNQQSLNVTMARHGYFGTAPLHPSMAISTRVLELLQALTVRCPQLSIQAFVKSLCELHLVCFYLTCDKAFIMFLACIPSFSLQLGVQGFGCLPGGVPPY
jgi:hypothetical protein